MATDNKQVVSDGDQNTSTEQVNGRGIVTGASKGRLPGGLRLIYLAAGVLAFIALCSWLYFGLHIGQKVYAQAAGHKVYKKEIEYIKNGNTNISDRKAATVLADKYLTEAMAKENDVTVTNADIVKAYGSNIEQQKDNNPYTYQNLVNQLYFSKLNAANQGTFKGKLLVANFSRNVPYDTPLLPEKKATNPNLGNPAAIAADKKYAKEFITDLYNQITAGKITFDQAIKMEHENPVVGEKAYVTQDHSTSFDGPVSQINLLNTDAVKDMLVAQQPGTTTKPFVVKIPASMYNDSKTEGYYLVVRLDSKSGHNSKVPFLQELAQAKKKMGYKVNV